MVRTAEQQKKSTERAYLRKMRKRQDEREASATDVDTGERFEVAVIDSDGAQTRNRAPVVQENLKLLSRKVKTPEQIEEIAIEKRIRYAAMQTNMEIAAAVIACGGNNKLAARKAGISARQVRKYMESAVFRERVQELQETLGSTIRGRVLNEVKRRTSPSMIQKMELLDLLRVGDRVGLGRGNASNINVNTEIHQYESTFAAIVLSNAGEESEDFPTYEPSDFSVSDGNPPE